MKRCALLVFAVFFLSLGTLFADDIPHDPIIDIERGTGTEAFFGTATFEINTLEADGTMNPACSFFDANHTIETCGTQTSFIRTQTFGNLTGQDITSLDLNFTLNPEFTGGQDEGTFTSFQGDETRPGSPFNQVNQISGFEAIFSGGDITHNCSLGDGVFCDPNSDFKTSEFTIGFAEVLIPTGGKAVIAISSVPEPPAAALMLGGLCVIWAGRRWYVS